MHPHQGVGETLRGTINNEVDQRFPRSNADKAAQADAKNAAALDKGQREMAGLRERNALQPTVNPDYNKNLPYLPHQPQGTYHPNAPSQAPTTVASAGGGVSQNHGSPGGGGGERGPWWKRSKGEYIPPSGSAVDGDTHYTALPNMPAYNNGGGGRDDYHPGFETAPESVASSETSEKRRFRKLIKRRPVPTR